MHQDLQLEELVELVDPAGHHAGEMGKLAAHRAPGKRHRAFSAFLFDPDGRLLLQRRAPGKYHSPGLWSNSCCGHPRPGEAPEAAVRRKIHDELSVYPHGLVQAGTVNYLLTAPVSGLVEHEYNHVFVGFVRDRLLPDPLEVADIAMVIPAELQRMRAREPFSVWFDTVAEVAMTAVPALLPGLASGT